MKTLTVKVIEKPGWLAYRCKLQDEAGDTTLCPFFGAECPLGLVSCGSVTPKMWKDLFEEEGDEADAGDGDAGHQEHEGL